jgi:hypothetical protein
MTETNTQTVQTDPWYTDADLTAAGFTGEQAASELKGYLENRGWAAAKPHEVALHAIKAHREAEKHLGVPPALILRMPKDASDTQAWAELKTKLGVPADGKYDFSAVKFKDDSPIDDAFAAKISPLLQNALVPKDRAADVVKGIVAMMDEATDGSKAEYDAKVAVEKDTLRSNWGPRFNANMTIAQNTAAKLGVTPAQVEALEKAVGYAGVMDMFLSIGQKTGEDTFVRSLVPTNDGIMTRDQAKSALAEKVRDTAWAAKLEARDAQTMREFDSLTRLATNAE